VQQNVYNMPGTVVPVMDAEVTASRIDSVTGQPIVATATTDAMGGFVLVLRPEPYAPLHLTIKAPAALGLPPIALDGTPAELDALPDAAFTFLAPEEYFQVVGEALLDDATTTTPLPNVRVRVLDVASGTAIPLGLSAISDCNGQFFLRLPPDPGGLFRLRLEALETGATPACDAPAVCTECAGQCAGNAAQAPVVATVETSAEPVAPLADVFVPGGTVGPDTRSFHLAGTPAPSGMSLCPPPTTTVTVSIGDGMAPVAVDVLDAASLSFTSTELDAGGTFATTIATADLRDALNAAGAVDVTLPWGSYDVRIGTGPTSPLATTVRTYTTPVQMTTDATRFDLDPKTFLTGSVTDPAGVPLIGATIEARKAGDPNGGDPEWTATSDMGGTFTLLLSPGAPVTPLYYDLTVRAPDQAPWVERDVPVVESGDPLTYPAIVLMPASIVTGTIDGPEMLPLENARVTVYLVFVDGTIGYPLDSTVTTGPSSYDNGGYFKLYLPTPGEGDLRLCQLVDCTM